VAAVVDHAHPGAQRRFRRLGDPLERRPAQEDVQPGERHDQSIAVAGIHLASLRGGPAQQPVDPLSSALGHVRVAIHHEHAGAAAARDHIIRRGDSLPPRAYHTIAETIHMICPLVARQVGPVV